MTALGFGLAGQAFGMWAGAVAGAAEASQRLFVPLGARRRQAAQGSEAAPATVAELRQAEAASLKVVAKTEPAPKVVVKAEPAAKLVAKADRRPPRSGMQPRRRRLAKAEPAEEAVASTCKVEAAAGCRQAAQAPTARCRKISTSRARSKRPAAPDDLKAISGIGPKLEKVLNDLGVWTYAQVAGWEKAEVAWVDDYLSFSGRIGRDKWIEQAAALCCRFRQSRARA